MNTKLVSRDEKKIVFTSEISSEAFEASVNRVYNKMKSRFNIPGFRKGKAPRKIIELNYGEGIFFEDAVNELLPELFEEAEDYSELLLPISINDEEILKKLKY